MTHSRIRGVFVAAFLFLASALAAAAPPTLAASQFNDGAPVDTAAVGNRVPLVLVHGLGGSTEGWETFLRAYAANPAWRVAFKPYSFRYSTDAAEVVADPAAPRTITALGAALRDAMQGFYDRPAAAPDYGFGNKRVIVLAHSMGGLVTRSMMQEHAFRDGERGGQKVLHLITLGTAHHGTPLADVGVVLGRRLVAELSDTYAGFLEQLTWTNFDGLNMIGGRCNDWLAALNNYAPATGASYGRCGAVPANPLPGYYERIIAYGTAALQQKDAPSGAVGVYKPGSSSGLQFPHDYLLRAFGRPYPNDGVVPMASAQFAGPALWQRGEAFHCDHRYIRRGYEEFVRSPTATYVDWAFCAATPSGAPEPSGVSGGYAVSGSIMGVAGGIVETITTVWEVERAFNWTEAAHAAILQPPGGGTDISASGFYYRFYPSSHSFLGVKDGSVYYLGPLTGWHVLWVGRLADFVGQAQAAGL